MVIFQPKCVKNRDFHTLCALQSNISSDFIRKRQTNSR